MVPALTIAVPQLERDKTRRIRDFLPKISGNRVVIDVRDVRLDSQCLGDTINIIRLLGENDLRVAVLALPSQYKPFHLARLDAALLPPEAANGLHSSSLPHIVLRARSDAE